MLGNQTRLVQIIEQPLCDFGALVVGGTAELVKIDMEPVVDFCMLCKIIVAEFPWSLLFLQSSGLGGSTILISTADIEGVITPKPAEPCKNITGKHLDKVSQMRNIVYIRQCRCYQSSFHQIIPL